MNLIAIRDSDSFAVGSLIGMVGGGSFGRLGCGDASEYVLRGALTWFEGKTHRTLRDQGPGEFIQAQGSSWME